LSSLASEREWTGRRKSFFVNDSAAVTFAAAFSGFAVPATGASATAAPLAALKPVGNSAGMPTPVISGPLKAGSTTGTVSAPTGDVAPAAA